jgi:hypothetical protein
MLCVIAFNKVTLGFKLSDSLTKDHSTKEHKEYQNWSKNNVIQLAFSNENKYITNAHWTYMLAKTEEKMKN